MTADGTMTLVERTVFLKSVELFAEVPSEALAELAGRAHEVRVDRGRALFREGDPDQGTFIVVEGEIELRTKGTVVRVLQGGMTQGELFLREREPHQYTAVARVDSTLLNLKRADVLDALLEYPEFGLAMVQELARRLHALTERVVELETRLRLTGGHPDGAVAGAIESEEPSALPRRRRWWRLRLTRPVQRNR